MNCSRDLIEAYIDQELDAARQAEVEQHVATCRDCSEIAAILRKQKAGIKLAAPYYNAPGGLQQAIRNELRGARTEEVKPIAAARWRWLAIAASLLLAVSVSWNVVELRRGASESSVAENVLSDHIRSLIGAHLIDVASSDQHTVKPWFAGQLDFSPDVRDLEAQGFPLAGGRLEYLAGRRVAALVYRRRLHVINLFIWPGKSGSSREGRISANGYNLVHWTTGAMTYWAVSDVSAEELETFRMLYR